MTRPHVLAVAALLAAAIAAPALAQDKAKGTGKDKPETLQETAGNCADPLEFNQVLTGKPLPVYKPDEEITPAVETFHCTGEDPYFGDAAAEKEGKDLFRICASCHNTDATGRIGPNLVDDTYKYPRVENAHGEFEVIYGGAAGAMQPMGRRFTQDQILKIMAYLETLKAK